MPSEELSVDFAPKIAGLIIMEEFICDEEEQCLLTFMNQEFEKSN